MYEDILREMRERIIQKEQHYTEWRRNRQEELMDMAREVDVLMDRRRNRKARMQQNLQQKDA